MGNRMQRDSDPKDAKLTRRAVLGTAAAVTMAAHASATETASAGCRIGPPPHPKGPLVFMNYDQIELDAAYDQSSYAPLAAQIQARRTTNSEEVRRRLGEPRRESYGPSEVEKLDIFRTNRANAPIFMFVHGGAWLGGSSKEYHFAAENITSAGAHYVTPDFIAVGAANRLYLCGQSSGAHLSGVALVTDWQKDFGLPADMIKGGVLLSGMYEMKPVRLSARAKYVKFDDAMEESMSTIRHIERLRAPLALLYGTNETPEFQRQTRDFAAAVKGAGKPVQLIVAPNHNHYELQETMANPYGWGGRAALAMMGLGKA